MPDTTTPATRPTRQRAARPAAGTAKAAASKAPAKAAAAKAPAATTPAEVTRFTVELVHVGTTKAYEKFGFPDDMKGVAVGSVYAPLGSTAVKVLIIGANDPGAVDPA